MSTVQLPRMLDDNFLEITRLHPDKLSVDLLLSSVSTANMSVSQDEERIEVGRFVELFTVQGSAGIFVVKSVAYDPDTRRQDVYLEHGVATLANNLMEGEEEKEGTAWELLTALLACQTRQLWKLGVVESSETLKWSCDYSNVLESIVNLMEQLPAHALTFDQTSMPWVLNLVRMPDADACECRLTRNMESLTVDVDRTDLCTRLYIRGIGKKKKPEEEKPPDEGTGESPGEGDGNDVLPPLEDFVLPPQDQLVERYSETIEADTMATWGIVERVLEADMELPLDELMRQGRIYLEERKNPAITITLDAFDLYQATGEPFDRFRLGRICRVCLPEYAAVIRHRVVGMTYTDALAEPERVTVTLATQRADGIDTIAGIIVNTALHSEQIGRLQINKIVANGMLELLADEIRLHAKHILLEADKIELLAKEILLQAEKIELNAENIRLWGDVIDELSERFAEVNIDVENALIELRAGLKEITDMGERISRAEVLIDGANALIALKASREEVEELAKRVSEAEIKIDGANARIDLYAQRTDETLEGLDRRISSAEISIDGANARIDLYAQRTDETLEGLDRRISSAEISIDGANARIDLKASREDVIGLDSRITSAEIAIDGANARIDLITGGIDVSGLETRISNAEIAIDGLNADIKLKANQSTVNNLGTRVSSAEIDINGLEASISLKANASTVTALSNRVSSAEVVINGMDARIDAKAEWTDLAALDERVVGRFLTAEAAIDAMNSAITLKASATTVTELGEKVSSAEIAINGLESAITMKADKIDLQGFVTADDLETEILNVLKVANIENLVVGFLGASSISGSNLEIFCDDIDTNTLTADVASTETLWATGAHIATLNATDATLSTVNGYKASRATLNVVVNDPQIVVAKDTITYVNSSGNTQSMTVVTGVALQTSNKGTISYLQLI